jgi:hypothetical protein
MLRKLWPEFVRSARNSKRKRAARRSLSVERLEDRSLLAAVPTLITLSASSAALTYGQSETLTATVTVASPNTGTPTGGRPLAAGELWDGTRGDFFQLESAIIST